MFPGPVARLVDWIGIMSHVNALGRGVWDLRDLLYFGSTILFSSFI